MTSPQIDGPLSTHWRQQNRWSKAANEAKNKIERSRGIALLLTTIAAVLSTTSAQIGHWNAATARVLAVLAAVALALAPVLGREATHNAVRDWTRLRSVSEALKTEVYMYLAGVGPYRAEDRLLLLQDKVEEIAEGQPDLKPIASSFQADDRELPNVHDVASYIALRLNGQIHNYYRPKAIEYRRTVGRLRLAEVLLTAFAAVLAAVAGFFPRAGLSAWVAVLTTIGAAVAAHAAAQRYGYQQIEFARTADRLETLQSHYEIGPHDEAAADKLVNECEQTISIENSGWMAKLISTDEPG